MSHNCNLFLLSIWFILINSSCQQKEKALFRLLSSTETGVNFNNLITDNDSFNILTYEYIYNGGGVALADFNNDQLIDIFFTGNMVSNRLFLNKGNFQFEDISEKAGIEAADSWCSGIATVDINSDGWEDLYVSTNTHADTNLRRNLLFVSQGLDSSGIPYFVEMGSEYGLADTSYSMNAVFFDYDNDLDLDLFIIVNEMHDLRNPVKYRAKKIAESRIRVDKLYQNNWNDSLAHPFFTDVSKQAGIDVPGYSLGVNITDINQDGWQDIYISNDFISNDILYLNNQDGTFEDVAKKYFKHTSHSAMGNDVMDINNDGLVDIITLDMLPEDNYRRKTMMGPGNYMSYINNRKFGYDFQFVRNTLQVNRGENPVEESMVFSDVSFLAGISATDWSWSPMVADFDHNGYRDLIITNGFPKDITDRDFTDYQADIHRYAPKRLLLTKVPEVKLTNYAFRNKGNLKFENVSQKWGIDVPSFSNGSAYADLDNDGDLDYVVNNINDPAFIYENLLLNHSKESSHYLRIKLKGPKENPHALGTKLSLYAGADQIYYEQNIYRGYLSSIEPTIHIGLGSHIQVDSIEIIWPDLTKSMVPKSEVDKVIYLDFNQMDKVSDDNPRLGKELSTPWLARYSPLTAVASKHEEFDYVDFNVQPLVPHKFSQFGPGLAVGDINKDGLSDLLISGSALKSSQILLQTKTGGFIVDSLEKTDAERRHESLGALFFDADLDGDDDLYMVSGGFEFPLEDSFYLDRFYRNNEGRLELDLSVIPQFHQSGSCVRAADYDRDGDLDLIVAGRVLPHKFPKPCSTILLENQLEKGELRFAIANETTAPELNDVGNVSDITWSDFDQDGWIDLIVAGEWMPISVFRNMMGSLVNITSKTGLSDQIGWWTSIIPGDIDLDGDVDYVIGNFGKNMLFQASDKFPVGIYANDFDKNGGFDAILTAFFPSTDGELVEYPVHGRSDFAKQINKIKDTYTSHDLFARAAIDEILNLPESEGTLAYRANQLASVWIENRGEGQFKLHELPLEVQVAPIYGGIILPGHQDQGAQLLLVGNDFGTDLFTGRCDAFNGLVLEYGGEYSFKSLSIAESGFYVPGDAKSMVMMITNGRPIFLVGQNQGDLLAFQSSTDGHFMSIALKPNDVLIKYELDNKMRREEAYYGSGFLSQSQRTILLPRDARNIVIVDYQGETRNVSSDTFSNENILN
ncbi:MAG: VCBS repeat-containing protein [Saprospiraceae bacterium]|nr:VCBS repeat-containing protein [Saprospiraceae bacterium]